MSDFVKLYGSILDSSVWAESKEVRILWVTMLALADDRGRALVSAEDLARCARIDLTDCESALNTLTCPNADGETWVKVIDGGWSLAPRCWSISAPPVWSKEAYQLVYARDGASCRYCGSTQNLSLDHVVPRCQGGGDDPDNLVVACRVCNSRKGGRTPEQAGMVLQ